ncbi:VOC family protein [Maritimibacter sp. UBA3975]|uniref:VOC family protein n=1 Tax=Maritimibacter sp. UBA3975 TaxID=1946833 RepID=UPI000C0B4B44|nr:VOC family protein [Maritimibacter sp. UBA3975]MAM61808.1 glyoxalase [Maritimibacter sp.]|tara:strand:- start:4994 stop:5359 length:366 start_codon:yes stop_codon:yes gene_type:complete
MAKVTGIGGVFFRSDDPGTLAEWYWTHLGIDLTPSDAEERPWMQEAGPTVFAPFPKGTDYFGRDSQQFMLNFRVDDLAGMVAALRKAGLDISHEEDMTGVGRFARIHDPEGNPVELWEPAE